MLGFNFYRPSPRYIAPRAAARIVRRLPRSVQAVGVFVNEPPAAVDAMARAAGLHAVQLHGDESAKQSAQLARRWRVIKAFRVRPRFRVAELKQYEKVHAFLLDGFSRKALGGTGKMFDWRVAKRAARFGRIFLAGGLRAENIAEALQAAKPHAVDVCSGIEAAPGKKDHAELLKFALIFHAANNR